MIKEVSSALRIDELTATGGSTEDLTVVAGKRFSDRVFVRYSYQTFTRTSAILFELLLSRRLVSGSDRIGHSGDRRALQGG